MTDKEYLNCFRDSLIKVLVLYFAFGNGVVWGAKTSPIPTIIYSGITCVLVAVALGIYYFIKIKNND